MQMDPAPEMDRPGQILPGGHQHTAAACACTRLHRLPDGLRCIRPTVGHGTKIEDRKGPVRKSGGLDPGNNAGGLQPSPIRFPD